MQKKTKINGRRKGHSFERLVSILLRPLFPGARRQLEYHLEDARGVDVQGTGRFKFQCKKLRVYAPITKIEEIQCDRDLGDVPVLVTSGDGKPPMAVLPFDDFLTILKVYLSKP